MEKREQRWGYVHSMPPIAPKPPMATDMTMRDHFAGMAMNQMIPGILKKGDERLANDTAMWAYVFADAMMEARKQTPQDQ